MARRRRRAGGAVDAARARRTRAEEPAEPADADTTAGPEDTVVLADSVGLALLVLLERLGPAERLAFVLHDLFGLPFDEIAPIVDRTPTATRQLASRARRRLRDAEADDVVGPVPPARREVVEAFLAASRGGDLAALLRLLHPDVVLRADDHAVTQASAGRAYGAPELSRRVRGAESVARAFCGRASASRPALIEGAVGAAYAPQGWARSVFRILLDGDRIAGIDVVADPDLLATLDVVLLEP